MRLSKWFGAPALILISTLALAGCGGDGSARSDHHGGGTPSASAATGTAPAGEHNEADVTFATHMIPHHQQAIQMSEMAIRKATTAEVKQLATAIKAAQGPEIRQLSSWLTGWGEPVPSPEHGGHGTADMPGMLTEDELSDLGNATGARFDRMWTASMIEHHKGAVTMARTEQSAGKNPAAIALAKKIETDQTREIATLQRLLARLPVG